MKKRNDKGEYFKKGEFYFAFSRFFNNFALKLNNYEEETIHRNFADGGFCAT